MSWQRGKQPRRRCVECARRLAHSAFKGGGPVCNKCRGFDPRHLTPPRPTTPTPSTTAPHVDIALSGERILRVSALDGVVVLRIGLLPRQFE
jgi:hypothetical protein